MPYILLTLLLKRLKPNKMADKIYSISVYASANKFTLRSEIINADVSNKETRKEIQRIFHTANRRLQNIENAGVYSPAAKAVLNQLDGYRGFSKFSMQNKEWNEIKMEYAMAVEFLRKPTSTATGARQLQKQVQKDLGLNEWQMEQLTKRFMYPDNPSDYFDISSSFEETVNYFEREAKDVATQIENAASRAENTKDLDNVVYNELKDGITKEVKNAILDSLKKYEL